MGHWRLRILRWWDKNSHHGGHREHRGDSHNNEAFALRSTRRYRLVRLMLQGAYELGGQGGDAVPGDLDSDGQRDERHDADDSLDRSRRNCPGQSWRIRIASPDAGRYHNRRSKDSGVRQQISGKLRARCVSAQGQHGHYRCGARRDGEGERVEDLLHEPAVVHGDGHFPAGIVRSLRLRNRPI
jgi:hypothetical protein